MANFRLADRDSAYLLPPSVDEWLPDDHLARFVVEIVDQLDVSALEGDYQGSGSDAYHPRMMLALLFYSYASGVFSSRRIETGSYDSVATRYVAANQHPDHDTICSFRRRFFDQLSDLFVQILMIAAQMDLVSLGDIAFDGSKFKANAGKHKAMSWKRACELEEQLSEEVAELLERAEQVDGSDGADERIPEEIAHRKERLQKIRQAKAMIEERAEERYEAEKAEYEQKMAKRAEKQTQTGKKIPGREPAPPEPGPRDKDQVNFTDPASRIMKDSQHGWQQAWNVQAGVCMDSYLLVSGYVSGSPVDKQELENNLEQVASLPEPLGTPERTAVDSGYFSEANVNLAKAYDIEPYISSSREKHHWSVEDIFAAPDPPPEDPSPLEAMAWRMQTEEGKEFYSKRKSTVEPVFGIIKQAIGFRQFLHRGLQKVDGEWNLIKCSYNLKRMHTLAA